LLISPEYPLKGKGAKTPDDSERIARVVADQHPAFSPQRVRRFVDISPLK